MKDFSDLTEPELLALAIALEEEDSRIYDEFAHGIGTACSISTVPSSANTFR
jgi:hypothetical protein